MATEVILLERVDNLGDLGDVVTVKPGYARNFLIPQQKALRATNANKAYFDAQKSQIEKKNQEKRKDAEKQAKQLEGLTVAIIRHASEGGQLYGSVAARDIAEAISDNMDVKVTRGMIVLHEAFKTIGLFDVTVVLHPEVRIDVRINVARSEDEAKIQEETGKALIADEEESIAEAKEEALEEAVEEAKEQLLDDSALEAEKLEAEEREAKEQAKAEAEEHEARDEAAEDLAESAPAESEEDKQAS